MWNNESAALMLQYAETVGAVNRSVAHLDAGLYLAVPIHDGQYGVHAAVFHQVGLVPHQNQRDPEHTRFHLTGLKTSNVTVTFCSTQHFSFDGLHDCPLSTENSLCWSS